MTDTPSSKGAISRVKSQAEAAEAALVERVRRQQRAREKLKAEPEAPKRQVTCRVLPLGDNMISQGQHVPGLGEAFYERNEEFTADEDIARTLETRGFAVILPDAPAPEPAAESDTPAADAEGE